MGGLDIGMTVCSDGELALVCQYHSGVFSRAGTNSFKSRTSELDW